MSIIMSKKPPFERSLWNIIEDCRIEKALGDAYPGMVTNLNTLVSELLRTKAGIFEVPPGSPPEAVICGYVGLTLRTLYLKQHVLADQALTTRDQFLNTFSPKLEKDLFSIITQIGSVKDTAGVVKMVKQVVTLLEKHKDVPDTDDSDSNDNSQELPQTPQELPPSPQELPQSPQELPQTLEEVPPASDNQDQPDKPGDSQQGNNSELSGIIPDDPNQSQPNHPLDQQGAQNDSSIPVPDNPVEANLDNPATLTEKSLSENQAQEDQVSDAASLGVGNGSNHSQSDLTPEQEAITQALNSDQEISDFGQQLRELARDNEHLLGNDPQSFRVAVPAPKHLLPRYAYSRPRQYMI